MGHDGPVPVAAGPRADADDRADRLGGAGPDRVGAERGRRRADAEAGRRRRGVYSALLIARASLRCAPRRWRPRSTDLRRRLDQRQTVVRAVDAAGRARQDRGRRPMPSCAQMAMAWRVSFEEAAARIVGHGRDGTRRRRMADTPDVRRAGARRTGQRRCAACMRRKLALFGLAIIVTGRGRGGLRALDRALCARTSSCSTA